MVSSEDNLVVYNTVGLQVGVVGVLVLSFSLLVQRDIVFLNFHGVAPKGRTHILPKPENEKGVIRGVEEHAVHIKAVVKVDFRHRFALNPVPDDYPLVVRHRRKVLLFIVSRETEVAVLLGLGPCCHQYLFPLVLELVVLAGLQIVDGD